MNIKDAYKDHRFSRAADRQTGYRTKSLLTCPVRNKAGAIVAVLQIVNKMEDGATSAAGFEPQDEALVEHFSDEIGEALESGVRAEESRLRLESLQNQMEQMKSQMGDDTVRTKAQATMMIRAAKDIAAVDTRDALLTRVIEDACELVSANRATLYLYDEDTTELVSHNDESGKKERVSSSKGKIGQVFTEMIPMCENADSGSDEASVLIVPVRVKGDDVADAGDGVLRVEAPEPYSEESQQLLAAFAVQVATALCNMDHAHEANAAMRALEAKLAEAKRSGAKLHEMSAALAQDLGASALFSQVVSRSRDILKADRATLFLVDEASNELYSMVANGSQTIRLQKSVGIAGHVTTTGSTVNISDCYADSRFNKDMDLKTGYKTVSMICMAIPDVHGHGSVGCLQLLNKLSDDAEGKGSMTSFSENDEALLKQLVGEIAVAVNHLNDKNASNDKIEALNAQMKAMEDKMKNSNHSAEQLLEYAKHLSSASELTEVFEESIRDARHLVQADRATLWLVDEEAQELYTHVAEGLDAVNGGSKQIRIGIGTGIVGHVVCSGEPFACEDAYDCDKFNPAVDRSSGYRTRQILCVPMMSTTKGKSSVVGAIQVVNRAEGVEGGTTTPFTDDEQQLLMTLGAQIVGAVEHCNNQASTEAEKQASLAQLKQMQAQLAAAKQEGSQRDGLLQNLAKCISGQVSFTELIDTVLEQACNLLGSDRAALFMVDESKGELWTSIGEGENKQMIRVPVGQGIVGSVARDGDIMNIKDAYKDHRFSRAADRQTGYRTKSLLTCPVRNKAGAIVAVIQLVNKMEDGGPYANGFGPDDEASIQDFALQAGDILESGSIVENSRGNSSKWQGLIDSAQHSFGVMLDLVPLILRESRGNGLERLVEEFGRETFQAESSQIWILSQKGRLVRLSNAEQASSRSCAWMNSNEGTAGHCLSTGDIVNLTSESGNKFGSNCGVEIMDSRPQIVKSVLCCPIEAKGRRVGVLQVLNNVSGAFDKPSDVQTSEIIALLIGEWLTKWDTHRTLEQLELACATLKANSQRRLKNMQLQMKERQANGLFEKKNELHLRRLERLHRLDHVVKHGLLMRGFRVLLRHAWHHSEEEERTRGMYRVSGLEKIRRAMEKLSGLQSIRRYGLRWGFEVMRRNTLPGKVVSVLHDHEQHSVVMRQRLRLHAARIRQRASTLLQFAEVTAAEASGSGNRHPPALQLGERQQAASRRGAGGVENLLSQIRF